VLDTADSPHSLVAFVAFVCVRATEQPASMDTVRPTHIDRPHTLRAVYSLVSFHNPGVGEVSPLLAHAGVIHRREVEFRQPAARAVLRRALGVRAVQAGLCVLHVRPRAEAQRPPQRRHGELPGPGHRQHQDVTGWLGPMRHPRGLCGQRGARPFPIFDFRPTLKAHIFAGAQ